MKVFAINSSARVGGQSKTEIILEHLVKGMREEGAEVEIVNIFKKKINYCIGCFTCWTKTPGKCVHRDDMSNELFPKFMASDLCVMATPLFHFTVNANLKTFIERTLPFVQPFFEKRDGVTHHPLRWDPPPIVAVSVAGFPEDSVFDQLSSYMKYIYGKKLLAEIYRPAAESLGRDLEHPSIKGILEAIVQGGRELVKSGSISEETMAGIKYKFTNSEDMGSIGNIYWQTCIDEGITPKEFDKRKIIPRPNSIETYLTIIKMGFNPKKAGDFKASIQYRFSGAIVGDCYLKIEKGELTAGIGSI
ncbi:flavodoxin family protein, partial [bacterium]|nr:flavodoxin family protein [bacterium]